MNEIFELFNEKEISQFETYYGDISNNFKSAISIDPNFEKEISETYIRFLSNIGKLTLNMFNLKYFKMFNLLANYYKENDELQEFSDSLLSNMTSYFKELDSNIYIKNSDELDELQFILQLSLINLEAIFENKDIDLAYETFFSLERRIKHEKLYMETYEYHKHIGDTEFKLIINRKKQEKTEKTYVELENETYEKFGCENYGL